MARCKTPRFGFFLKKEGDLAVRVDRHESNGFLGGIAHDAAPRDVILDERLAGMYDLDFEKRCQVIPFLEEILDFPHAQASRVELDVPLGVVDHSDELEVIP